jgi:hypothetical protein
MKNFDTTHPQLNLHSHQHKINDDSYWLLTSCHGCIDHILELVTKLAFKSIPDSLGSMSACCAIDFFSILILRLP